MRATWNNIRFLQLIVVMFLSLTDKSSAQDNYYDQGGGAGGENFEQDNLYHNYAARQQEKVEGGGGGPGWMSLAAAGSVGWFVGAKFHTHRQKKKLNKKHKAEQKELYQQYYDDVYSLSTQNAELVEALEKAGYRLK